MRLLLVFLISLLFSSLCCAEEILLGRIISIDQEGGTVSMEVLEGPPDMRDGSGRAPEVITLDRKALPEDIRENTVVRVWGTVNESTGQFTAQPLDSDDLPGRRPGGRAGNGFGEPQDATGVRQRIGKGSGRGNGGHGGHGGR